MRLNKQQAMEEEAKVVQMARHGMGYRQISAQVAYTPGTVVNMIKKHNIASRAAVIQLLEQEADDTVIAQQTNWELGTVTQLRKTIQEKQAQLKADEQIVIQMAHEGKSTFDIVQALEGRILDSCVEKIKRSHQIARKSTVKKLVLEEADDEVVAKQTNWTPEAISLIRQGIKRRYFKEKMNSLRRLTRRLIREQIPKEQFHLLIDRMLVEYKEFLTPVEYAYIAYVYIKIEEAPKALELGKAYLGVNDFSIISLMKRVDEILEQQRKDKKIENCQER